MYGGLDVDEYHYIQQFTIINDIVDDETKSKIKQNDDNDVSESDLYHLLFEYDNDVSKPDSFTS